MGSFHVVCIFMAMKGKIYSDAGLRLIQSTERRVEQLLRGKHYNSAMFARLCVYESFYGLKINAFENWLSMKEKYQIFRECAESNDVSDFVREQSKENMVNVLGARWEFLNLMCEY